MNRYLVCIIHLTDGPGTYILEKDDMPGEALSDVIDHEYLMNIPWNDYKPKMNASK